jgi:hypothetical protein
MMTAGAAVFAADLPPAKDIKAIVETGRVGAKARRAARPYSGTPLMPMNPNGLAKTGAPENANRCSDCKPADIVQIKTTARSTSFVPGTAPAVKKTAGPAAAKASAASNAAYDPADPRAQMINPPDGSTLNPVQSFEWSSGDGVDDYYMQIGSCFQCADLLDEDEGMNLIRTVSLPVDGRIIYVSLFSSIDGLWYELDYEYQAASGAQPVAAQMIAPANGSTLSSPQSFSWNSGYSVDDYYLQLGSCEGCNDLYDRNEGGNLSDSVSLPADGRTVYARLFSHIQGSWWYYEYQYRAPLASSGNSVRVNVANPFAFPVNIAINGKVLGSVPAFSTAGTNVTTTSLSLSFTLVQPTLNGRNLGDPVSGIFQTINNPSGTYNFQISNQIGSSFYFMPVITNRTSQALLIDVNGGLSAENRCNCEAPASTDNVAPGYYLLFANSNVRLFLANSNYNGAYEYWGTTANPLYKMITDSSAEVHLTVTNLP